MRAIRSADEVICDAVPNADHSFASAEGDTDGWTDVWERVLEWYVPPVDGQ